MPPIQTFFLESTGVGRVIRWKDDQPVILGECPQDDFGQKLKGDAWQPLYRRSDTGEPITWATAPVGATQLYKSGMFPVGPDGMTFVVKCPGGNDWIVDSRASNCDMPNDFEHRCWIRHGDPRQCNVTVDKQGLTCTAGAGSIIVPDWHGWLRDGKLVEC